MTERTDLIAISELSRIQLGRDEVLLVTISEGSAARVAAAAAQLTRIFGEDKVVVAGKGAAFQVVKKTAA